MKRWIFALLAASLLGCSPQKEVVPVPPPVPAPTPSPPKQAVGPIAAAPPARVFDESLLHGREFLLEAAGPAVPPVRDPVVGTLNRDAGVVTAVETLFRAAAGGELDRATLVDRWADYLEGWARRARTEGLAAGGVRVGQGPPETAEGLMVPVRVMGDEKQFSGWVLLVKDHGSWLISDVQMVGTAPKAAPLDPESPNQAISTPILR